MNGVWQVLFSDVALKQLRKMDRPTSALIIGYIEKKLVGCTDPRSFGKPLTANHQGKWRYRVGDYRLLCLIEDNILTVTVIAAGYRSDIYQ